MKGFPGSSDGNESACNAGDLGLIPGSGRSPEEGNGNPLQYSCLENPHGQRSLGGLQAIGSQRVRHDRATETSKGNENSHILLYLIRTELGISGLKGVGN